MPSMEAERKRLSEQLAKELDATSSHFQEMQAKIDEIGRLVLDSVLRDLVSGKLAGYNAASAYSGLLASMCKVQRLRVELLERLGEITKLSGGVHQQSPETPEQAQAKELAEALLIHMVKRKLERQRQEDEQPKTRGGS